MKGKVLAAAADPEAVYIAQILPEKIALARQYIARSSLTYDLAILFQTLWRIVR